MKLIINISETDYNTYKHFGDKGSYTERIIANGVPYKQDDRPKGKWIPEKMNDKHNIGCLDKKVNIMEEDAKQASIPYSMPKDYIKNRLDYER